MKQAAFSHQLSLFLFIAILMLAVFVRLFKLDQLPTILNRDEAALAYNALLLKETGRDEWHRSWPIALESFGDYKLPGYPWLLIGSFSLFGYTDLAVRLPSALAGVGLVAVGFVLAGAIGLSTKYRLLYAFILAILPVSIFYSRIGFEANVGLLLLTSIITLLLIKVSEKKQVWVDILAVMLSFLAVFTYNTPFLLLPFIVIILPFIRGVRNVKKWLVPVVGFSIVFLIAAWVLLPLTSQKQGITIFSDETIQIQYGDYRARFSGFSQKLLGNKYVYFLQLMTQRLVASVSPNFLVIQGGSHPWHQLPGHAHLYWSIYMFAVVGAVWLLAHAVQQLRKKKPLPSQLVILYLTVVSLLPSIVTVDSPHATRSLLFFVLASLLAVQAVAFFVKKYGQWVLWLTAIVIVAEAGWYLRDYFYLYSSQQAALQPGFSTQIQTIDQAYPTEKVAIVDPEGYHYILLAWYLKTSPDVFFETVVRQEPDRIGFRYGQQVDRYHFIGQAADRQDEKVLLKWDDTNNSWQVTYND